MDIYVGEHGARTMLNALDRLKKFGQLTNDEEGLESELKEGVANQSTDINWQQPVSIKFLMKDASAVGSNFEICEIVYSARLFSCFPFKISDHLRIVVDTFRATARDPLDRTKKMQKFLAEAGNWITDTAQNLWKYRLLLSNKSSDFRSQS